MQQCESTAQEVANVSSILNKNFDDMVCRMNELTDNTVSQKDYTLAETKQFNAMLQLENDFDQVQGRTLELQNWMDIYMPLRIQHQIQETIKDCLPRRGKSVLGAVSIQMCNQLRERMFKDVGSDDLKERCLDVIKELKLEAAILKREKNDTTCCGPNQNSIPVLAKVTEEGPNIGDADSEAMAKM